MKRVLLVPSADIMPIDGLEGTRTLLRCQEALRLWQMGYYDWFILSGGMCHGAEVESQPAATTMHEWFCNQTYGPLNLRLDTAAQDTYQNMHGCVRVIEKDLNWKLRDVEIGVVSHITHLWRFDVSFRLNYDVKIAKHPVEYPLNPSEWAMELVGLGYHVADVEGHGALARRLRERRTRKINEVVTPK